MTEEQASRQQQALPPGRPVLLSIICILTFLGSGFMLMSFLFIGIFHAAVLSLTALPEYQLPGTEMFRNTPRWVFLTGSVLYLVSFLGGLFLWRMKKIGFHLYTSAQIALLFLTSIYMHPGGLPSGDLLFTSSFILLYALHLRLMK